MNLPIFAMDGEPESKRQKSGDLNEIRSIYFGHGKRIDESFFNVSCIDLAKNLLGTVLVRKSNDGSLLKGKIVETECYLGFPDKASHSYQGRRTLRNEPMFMKPGTLYVYQTYGMYHCVNISSEGEGAAVLLRAIEPLAGFEEMSDLRRNYHLRRKINSNSKSSTKLKPRKTDFKPYELCNGPSKLCISFNINIENCNEKHLSDLSDLWIEERNEKIDEADIISSTRIGIDSAGPEWAGKLLRFYVYGNRNVSCKDKKREASRTLSENVERMNK